MPAEYCMMRAWIKNVCPICLSRGHGLGRFGCRVVHPCRKLDGRRPWAALAVMLAWVLPPRESCASTTRCWPGAWARARGQKWDVIIFACSACCSWALILAGLDGVGLDKRIPLASRSAPGRVRGRVMLWFLGGSAANAYFSRSYACTNARQAVISMVRTAGCAIPVTQVHPFTNWPFPFLLSCWPAFFVSLAVFFLLVLRTTGRSNAAD